MQRLEAQRLSAQRQQELISVQQQRAAAYAQKLAYQQQWLNRQASYLQQQRRYAQYRYEQQYLDNLRRQQQYALSSARYDYYDDPYFYSSPSYQYNYNGRYYQTNQYGVDVLQDALNLGYQEGFRAAQADRQDQWRYDYRNSYAYQDANYGYNGLYLDQSQYNYYFRQGFQRGYDDGYYNRSQYGTRRNGNLELILGLLDQILRLRALG
ncbi:MAG TPA: hypothetical protein VGS57_15645 [Thermoanaerobaculia bacterium]|nr:hypothetical protein [Thermoanaerobaculia bacterium]